LGAWLKREEVSIPMEYTYGTKWVLIKSVDVCFIGEFQLNQIGACSIWFNSVGGLRND